MAIQTAERSSHLDPSENVIFQRHMIAYKQDGKEECGMDPCASRGAINIIITKK